jgi:hypothetical protein
MPNEIYVKIIDQTSSDNNSGVGESLTPQAQMRNQNPPSAQTAVNIKQTKAIAIASMVGSRSLNYISSNVGKWTGNSQNQAKVNNVQQIIGIAAMAAVSWQMALFSTALTLGTTAIDNYYEQKWDGIRSKQNLAKAGYNSSGEMLGRRR